MQVGDLVGLVIAILGLAVLIMVVMVIVAELADGKGSHRFAGLFAIGGAKHPRSNFLWFPPALDLFLSLFVARVFFINWMWLGQNRLFSSFFSLYASVLFCRDGNGVIYLLQELQLAVSVVLSFKNVWMVLTVSSTSMVYVGRVHHRKPKRKPCMGFKSQAIVCKNIYVGFIQFLLEDCWKPMWTNWSLVIAWCERVIVLPSSYVSFWIYL